jgi:hypothetical protein
MQVISILQRANVLPYASRPCKEWGFGITYCPKPHYIIYIFWVWTSALVPIYVHDDNRAPKPIQGAEVAPGDEVHKQAVLVDKLVPEDDGIPVDGEATVEPTPLLQRKEKGLLSIATSQYL